MLNRRFDLWLPDYIASAPSRALARWRRRGQLTHIMFLVCDHFEPRHAVGDEDQPRRRMQAWRSGYANLQQRCKDAFGTAPLHSWFYPPHHGTEHLASLAEFAHAGLGEIELHYHHDGDTDETLRRDLRATIDEYNAWGLLLQHGHPPSTAFGFIHGDWALNNSCGGKYCGVNDEISILRDLGCWADLTMPSGNRCQTRKINSIYYGVGDAARPKAHDRGPDARVGAADPAGLMLMQGPLAINWRAPRHPRPENASLTTNNWGRPDRVPVWLDCNIHVKGRPDWLFVKLHTHGAIERDFDGLFGEKAFALHRTLNEQYNDGRRYRLHYVTAREAYNIAKAAEDGKSGDPSQWRDYRVGAPVTRYYALDARHRVTACSEADLAIGSIESHDGTTLRTGIGAFAAYRGPLAHIEIGQGGRVIRLQSRQPHAELALTPRGEGRVELLGAEWVVPPRAGDAARLRTGASGECELRVEAAAPALSEGLA